MFQFLSTPIKQTEKPVAVPTLYDSAVDLSEGMEVHELDTIPAELMDFFEKQ